MWLDLLSGAQALNRGLAEPDEQGAPVAPQSGGVGPWAAQQKLVPGSFLEEYLHQSGAMTTQQRKVAPAPPVQQEHAQRISPLAKVVGASGDNAAGVDTAVDLGLKASSTVSAAIEEGKRRAVAAALEKAAAMEASKAVAAGATPAIAGSAPVAAPVVAGSAPVVAPVVVGATTAAANGTSAASATASSAGPIGWIVAGLISAYGGVSSSIKAHQQAKDTGQNREVAIYKALNRSDPAAPLRKKEIEWQEKMLDKLF